MKKLLVTLTRVKDLLTKKAKYRDSDELLTVRIWWEDLNAMFPNRSSDSFTATEFMRMYSEGKFTSISTVLRARRKINEELEFTRGKTYYERKIKGEKGVKDDLKKYSPF